MNPETLTLEEIVKEQRSNLSPMIMPDLPAFQAPDGTVISGRRAYAEYCRENNVTNPADYTQEWAKKAEDRARMFTPGSGHGKAERIETLKRAWDDLSTRRRR